MNNQQQPQEPASSNPEDQEEERKGPLTELFVAYLPTVGEDGSEKCNYLTNGEGGIRVFKSRQACSDWLEPQMSPEKFAAVVIHPIEAQLALPAELEPRPDLLSKIKQPDHLMPLMTFDSLGVPNALELLHNYQQRKLNASKNQKKGGGG
jgi:hypothetical protein